MKTKQIVFFAFLLFALVLFFNNVSAVSQCWVETSTTSSAAAAGACTSSTLDGGAGKVLMYLSGNTNAHGELTIYTSHQYLSVLCCNFGNGDTTTARTGDSNKLIGLSSSTNAHAERPENTGYSSKVYYDSFIDPTDATQPACFAAPSCAGAPNELEVLDLSSNTNAHSAQAGDTAYGTKICCAVATTTAPTSCTTANEATTCTGYKCDATAGTCKTSCTTATQSQDCQTNYVCTSGQCVLPPTCASLSCSGTTPICDTSGPTCVACSVSKPCSGGQTCNIDGSCSTSSGVCSLTDAYWSLDGGYTAIDRFADGPYGGDPVKLVVIGTPECNPEKISFEILEEGGFADDAQNNPQNIDFAADGSAVATWNAEWTNDAALGFTDDPEYYFIATVDGTTISIDSQSIGSELLHVNNPAERTCEPQRLASCGTHTTETACESDNEFNGNSCVDFSNIDDCDPDTTICSCEWDGSACDIVQLDVSPPSSTATFCGDGIIQRATEECDPGLEPVGTDPDEDLDGKQCTDLDSYSGLKSGETFGCIPVACQFNDARACEGTTVCGDGTRSPGEQCDPGTTSLGDEDFFGQTCNTLVGDGGPGLVCGDVGSAHPCEVLTPLVPLYCTVPECTIDDHCKVGGIDVGDKCVSGRCVKADGSCSGTDVSSCTPTTKSYVCISDVCVETGTNVGGSVGSSPSVSSGMIGRDSSSITISAVVDNGGLSTTVIFKKNGVTETSCTPASPLTSPGTVTCAFTGLNPNTPYQYSVEAENTKGKTSAGGEVWTDQTGAPVVNPQITLIGMSMTSSSATISAYVDTGGASTTVTFKEGTTTLTEVCAPQTITTSRLVSCIYSGTAGSTHNYQIDADNSAVGSATPVTGSFTIDDSSGAGSPILGVSTTPIDSTSEKISASVDPNGASTDVTFKQGTTTICTINDITSPDVAECEFTGLTADTNYDYTVIATNGKTTSITNSFHTAASGSVGSSPSVSSGIVALTSTSATIYAVIDPNDVSTNVVVKFDGTEKTDCAKTGIASVTMIQCNSPTFGIGTSHDYEVIATNTNGDSDSSGGTFTTDAISTGAKPEISILMTGITSTTARISAFVNTNDGGATTVIIKKGDASGGSMTQVCTPPAISSPGIINCDIPSLITGTSYTYEVTASNSKGDAVPVTGTFKTDDSSGAGSPIISVGYSPIDSTSEKISASVDINLGGDTTVRFKKGTDPNPICTQLIKSSGTAECEFTELTAATPYIYRVEAENSKGITSVSGSFTTANSDVGGGGTCEIDDNCDTTNNEICVEGYCVIESDSIGVDLTYCGDGEIQELNDLGNSEECEGTNLGTGITAANGCSDLTDDGAGGSFYDGGTLSCKYDCRYDYSQCRTADGKTPDQLDPSDMCGNGVIDDPLLEECDRTDFGMFGNACSSGVGEMTCDADCTLNTASCEVPAGDGLGTPIGKCTISTTGTDTCADDNFLTYTWSGVWKDLTIDTTITDCDGEYGIGTTLAGKCNTCTLGGTSTIACPAQIALPFFNIYNFIITSIAIALIYGAIILRRKGMIKIAE